MSKRILSLVLAFVMVLGTFGTVFADVATTPVIENEKVNHLIEAGIVKGDGNDYRLADGIRRDEVAALLVRMLGLETAANQSKNVPTGFVDVKAGEWNNGYVAVAVGAGLTNGTGGNNFSPERSITNKEVVAMLVRAAGLEEDGFTFPSSHIAAAAKFGITEELDLDMNAEAIREYVFEMVYNTIVQDDVANSTTVKAIVLENNRVERLSANEVVVEIIKESQTANFVEGVRADVGEQVAFTVDNSVDVEAILGRVVDLRIDANGNVVEVAIDETYKVVTGSITSATKNKVTLDKTTSYTVELSERYNKTDERIFRTYHNDTAYSYEEFFTDVKTADYARITIKNGKVLYINGFTFTDIAPVQEVKKDGADVYIYNDARDARVERYTPAASLIAFNDGEISRISRADIKANDVVHVYGGNKMVVRQDSEVEGTYEKVSQNTFGYWAHIEDEKYFINNVNSFRPVYGLDSKEFTTLSASTAASVLSSMKNEEVLALIDINGDLQLISAEVSFNENVVIIDNVLSRGEARFILSNNEKLVLSETFSTYYYNAPGSTINHKLTDFNRGELAFVINDEENIDTLARIATVADIYAANTVDPSAVAARKFDMSNDYINVGGTKYTVLPRTNVFTLTINSDGTTVANKAITATTVEEVRAAAKAGSILKAYVMTDANFDAKDLSSVPTSGSNRIAHTIVFVNVEVSSTYNYETIRVTQIDNVGSIKTAIHGVDADGNPVTRTVNRYTDWTNINVDDIVELSLGKTDEVVYAISEVIASNAPAYRVVNTPSYTGYRLLTLQGTDGTGEVFTVAAPLEFGGRVVANSIVTLDMENGYVTVIRSYSPSVKSVNGLIASLGVAATPVAPGVTLTSTKLVAAYSLGDTKYVQIEELYSDATTKTVTYKYLGIQDNATVLGTVGTTVILTKIIVNGETVVSQIN